MGLCGCYPSCSCMLTVDPPELLTITGDGDPATGGWVLTALETVFSAENSGGGISITPGGPYGHAPDFNIVIDPDSTAVVSVSDDGLRVDIDPADVEATAVADTDTIDLTLSGDIITGEVIPDPDFGLENGTDGVKIKLQDPVAQVSPTCENRLRMNTSGELTLLPDGLSHVAVDAGTAVSIPTILGADGGTALSTSFTNDRDCDVYAALRVVAFMEASPSNNDDPPAGGRIISMQARADVGGAATGALVGAIGTWSMTHIDDVGRNHDHGGAVALDDPSLTGGVAVRFRALLETTFLLNPGEIADVDVFMRALEGLSGYTSTPGAGTFFDTEACAWWITPRRI